MSIISTDLTSIYDDYLVKMGEKDAKRRKYDHFHPSEFGGCKRSIYLKSLGFAKNVIEAERIRIFQAGHAHHHRMQKHFADSDINLKLRGCWRCRRCGKEYGKEAKTGVYVPDNCECFDSIPDSFASKKLRSYNLFDYEEISVSSPEYNFKGNVDCVADFIDEEGEVESVVIDFKTIKDNRFRILREPDPKYIVQINIYMMCLGLKKGIIFYENKNTHEVREFVVKYDENLIAEVQTTAVKLKHMLDSTKNGSIIYPNVPKDYQKDKFPCSWCEVAEMCWKIEETRKNKYVQGKY